MRVIKADSLSSGGSDGRSGTQKHDEIPEAINRATRRAAASMKRKQKRRTTDVCD